MKTAFALLPALVLSSAFATTPTLTQQLFTQIKNRQIQNPSVFAAHNKQVTSWKETPYLFKSFIHIDYVGALDKISPAAQKASAFIRNRFQIPDNNFFVTAWTLNSLVVANQLDSSLGLGSSILNNAMTAEMNFLDQNNPGTSLTSFWAQKPGQKAQPLPYKYVASPQNLLSAIKAANSGVGLLKDLCNKLKSGKTACLNAANGISGALNTIGSAFHIPADTDDTSLNFAMGADLLNASRFLNGSTTYRAAYKTWRAKNSSKAIGDALFQILNHDYEPFSENQNSIDPRTYYLMQGFKAHQHFLDGVPANPDFALPTTWVMSLSGENDQNPNAGEAPQVAMPFNVNNVDATVVANFLYGIISLDRSRDTNGQSLLTEAEATNGSISERLPEILKDSSIYLKWLADNNLINTRPDLALDYYPSRYNFYFFESRDLAILNSYGPQGALLTVQQNLQAARAEFSDQLISLAKNDSDGTYWSDFLGNYGKTPLNEDALYSTSLALNALINDWTKHADGTTVFVWDSNTPSTVKSTIASGINWLKANINKNMASLTSKTPNGTPSNMNAFFSGSVKSMTSQPFFYPAQFTDIAGNTLNPSKMSDINPGLVLKISSVLGTSEYQQMVDAKHFGMPTPVAFTGYNSPVFPWPFWSAPVLTYDFALEALEKYQHIYQG